MKDTPIFICSKDRLSYLKKLLLTLVSQGYWNINIIDTGSTYPPMEQFLNTRDFTIIRVAQSPEPHLSLWTFNILDHLNITVPYVYTDCDCVPDCPHDWVAHLYGLMAKYPRFKKAGLGLRIDDLPDQYARKREVIDFEQRFWTTPLETDAYDSSIDTAIALYQPSIRQHIFASIRTGGTYRASHLPWYENSASPTDEDRWYKSHMAKGIGQWR